MTGVTFAGVPIEFIGVVLFFLPVPAALARVQSATWSVSMFPLAVFLAGASGAKSLEQGLGNWVMNVAAVASGALVLASASERFPRPADIRSIVVAAARRMRVNRRARLTALAAVCLPAILGLGLRANLQGVSAREAGLKNFLNWYSSHVQPADPRLRQDGRVRVLAFTDYQCPFCASGLPMAERLVRGLQASEDVPIDLVIHDFPIDAACNPAYWGSLHPHACEAAAAVRFVKRTQGEQAGAELAAWLYEHAAQLTTESIGAYLSSRGLDDGFRAARAEMLRLVSEDAVYGLRLGVSATPSFVVNGVKLPSGAFLDAAIRFELERARRGP
jgi:protein-disulfide isomerase